MSEPSKRRWLRSLKLDRVDLVGKGANPGAHVLIHKFDKPLEVPVPDEPVKKTGEAPDAPKLEEVTKTVPEEPKVEMVEKAELAKLQKQLEDEKAARVASDARIAKMEEDAKRASFIAKAADLGNMGPAPELGTLLYEVAKGVSEETFKSLEQILKAANAQVDKGALFATFGKQDDDTVDPAAKIDTLAKALVADKSAANYADAVKAVMKSHPELYSAAYGR